jgi:hypothetical protein
MKVCALEVTRDSTVCRADRRFVRRPAQKRDSPKPTSYTAPLPATLPRSRARCCREAAESTSLAAFSHGLERGKSACRMVHLYPAPLHVVLRQAGPEVLRRPPAGFEGPSMQDAGYRLPRTRHSRTLVNKALAASGLATHAIVIYATHRVRETPFLTLLLREECRDEAP